MTGVNLTALLAAVESHALATGRFEVFMGHEPKSKPGNGVTGAVWVQRMRPAGQVSGLAVTSVVVDLTIRVYKPFLAEPQDAIDPAVMDAVDALFAAYCGDFDLNVAAVFAVDLLGMAGPGLSAQAGFINQDGTTFRTVDISLTLIIADVYTQAA